MSKQSTYTSKYSLTDYTVTINVPAIGNIPQQTISIGGMGDNGEGSCVGEISVTRNTNLFETEGDPTGSWVHNKNLDKTGTVTINLRQVSDYVIKLITICSAYETVQTRSSGLTITITPHFADDVNTQFVECNDCYIQKVPDQIFAATAAEQSWVFTCGQILYTVSE